MANELQIFENKEFGSVRTLEINGKPYFCGSDVASALGYSNVRDAISRHCKGVVKRDTPTSSGIQSMSYIPEGDIYRLIARSKLPTAERFESWVFDEVLPTIRKHGMYAKDELLDNPDMFISVLQELKAEREQKRVLEQKIEADRHKVIFADAVSVSDSSMLVRDVAKIIKQNGVPLGEKRFYKWLRENGYVCQNSTSPTQRAMELGLFEIVVRTVERGNGLPIETKTTRITGKGQQYFINKFLDKVV